MVKWSRGNLVMFKEERRYDNTPGSTQENIDLDLNRAGAPDYNQITWQAGFLRGCHILMKHNDTLVDGGCYFVHGSWNGDTGWVFDPDYLLFVIPAGFEGWMCMDPDAHLDSNIDWRPRDQLWIRTTKGDTNNNYLKQTFFFTFEIGEEYLFDNDYGTDTGPPDFFPIFNREPQS